MSVGYSHNIGVLFADESFNGLTHPFFASVLNAFKNEAENHGYDLTFINHNVGSDGRSFVDYCRYRNLDGVLLACVDFYSEAIQKLLDSDIPCVSVDYPWPKQSCVLSDNRNGMKQLVDYAVSLGHSRIAFISGQRNSEVTETRRQEYLVAMADHKLVVPEGYLQEAVYSDNEVVREYVAKLLARRDRPTCILLPNDTTYFGAQEAIREQELRIPRDISLAGYDGIPLTQTLRPQLTTIRQNSEALGEQAAKLLIMRLEQPETAVEEVVTIPVELIKGSTVGWCDVW
jgi:LacI family transcriptional regulator